MDFKKKLKRFFTLTHKANDGFTLVELIVVIAILAILAGVGSVGYSGYIKAANKGADKTLVGNVMRAIETGTNSYAFVNDDSFKMGTLSYPVGFVALTTDGAKIVTSDTTMTAAATDKACEWVTVRDVAILTPYTYTQSDCLQNASGIYYTVSYGDFVYCSAHGPKHTTEEVGGQSYITGYNHTSGNWWCKDSCKSFTPVYGGTYKENAVKISNQESLYVASSAKPSLCEYAYANQNATYTGTTTMNTATATNPDVGEPLYDAIVAAFGSLDSMKLKYDGWTSDEDFGYATLYTYAPTMFSDIKTLATDLADYSTSPVIKRMEDRLEKDIISGEYDSNEDVMKSFSAAFNDVYGGDTATERETGLNNWITSWKAAADVAYTEHGFGFDGYNGQQYREYYSACRKAYNSSFASYLSSCGIKDEYVGVVSNFSRSIIGVGEFYQFPALANTSAFSTTDSGLNEKFYKAGDTVDTDGDGLYDNFEKCAELFEVYKKSAACTENAKTFYDTMITINATSDVADDENNLENGDMFAYYQKYLNEFAALYKAAQTAAGDGIVIIVTVEDGLLNFVVSPNAANPRNK